MEVVVVNAGATRIFHKKKKTGKITLNVIRCQDFDFFLCKKQKQTNKNKQKDSLFEHWFGIVISPESFEEKAKSAAD